MASKTQNKTNELLAQLREEAPLGEPPDGYASACEISEAVGSSESAVRAACKRGAVPYVMVRCGTGAVRYYDLQAIRDGGLFR